MRGQRKESEAEGYLREVVAEEMTVNCNRIQTAGPKLEFVRRSCLGCKINPGLCEINRMLEDTGILDDWKKLKAPNYKVVKYGTKR